MWSIMIYSVTGSQKKYKGKRGKKHKEFNPDEEQMETKFKVQWEEFTVLL